MWQRYRLWRIWMQKEYKDYAELTVRNTQQNKVYKAKCEEYTEQKKGAKQNVRNTPNKKRVQIRL